MAGQRTRLGAGGYDTGASRQIETSAGRLGDVRLVISENLGLPRGRDEMNNMPGVVCCIGFFRIEGCIGAQHSDITVR